MCKLRYMTILLLIFTAAPSEGFHLEIPLDAYQPPFWIIQNYVDRDPTDGYRDYMCGYLSYDKHHGTDFRVPFSVMVKGASVRSAAPGIVVRTRDHAPDHTDSLPPPQQSREEAGNAVLVDHENGFRTLYAHLRKGSVMVGPGGRVDAGEPLGLIGMSGRTEFPHLHFAVMYRGDFVCPFTGVVDREGCGARGECLWSENALRSLPYMPSGPISSGFTDQVPQGKVLESEIRVKELFTAESPAIVFWTLVYGVRAGDREVSRMLSPQKKVMARVSGTIDRNMAHRFKFIGKKRAAGPWSPGLYTGEYRLFRNKAGREELVLRVVKEAVVE